MHWTSAKVTAHTKVFQVIEGRNIPDWKKFLSVKENKQALINFFGDSIVKFNQSNPLVPPGNLYYIDPSTELVPCYLWCKLSTKGQNPATKELGKFHFRTASLDLIGPTGCDLLSAVNEGEKKCRNLVNSALSVGQSVSFHSPISKSKLKTFEHMNAKTSDLIYKISSLYHLHGTFTLG
jgi:hypothetical protein